MHQLPTSTHTLAVLYGILLGLGVILGFAWGYEHLGPIFNR